MHDMPDCGLCSQMAQKINNNNKMNHFYRAHITITKSPSALRDENTREARVNRLAQDGPWLAHEPRLAQLTELDHVDDWASLGSMWAWLANHRSPSCWANLVSHFVNRESAFCYQIVFYCVSQFFSSVVHDRPYMLLSDCICNFQFLGSGLSMVALREDWIYHMYLF